MTALVWRSAPGCRHATSTCSRTEATQEVHSAVSAEHSDEGDVAAISLPDWWIRSN